METDKSTLSAFISQNYAEFVKTTFAYTHKKYRTECATDVLEQFQDLQHKHDIVHCAYGILNEFVEYTNEFHKYGNMILKIDTLPLNEEKERIYCGLDAQLTAIKKEIGDIYYYKTMLLNLLEIDQPITDIEWESEEGLQVELLGDLIKKFVYYSHDLNVPAIKQACFDLDRCFVNVSKKLGSSLPEIISINEAKLRKRYPSGTFTSQEAAAKADTKNE